MKVGDQIKIRVNHGRWKIGHEGEIQVEKFEAWDPSGKLKTFDFGVRLDGDVFLSAFDETELEVIK